MSVRQPVRLLDISRITEAYPLELLADFVTGNFTLVNSSGSQIEHKKPGTLTVKYGDSTLANAQDLSGNIEITIPEPSSSITGNAATASKMETDRTFTIGSAAAKSFNNNIALKWTLSDIGAAAEDHNHDDTYLGINDTAVAATKLETARTFTIGDASPKSFDGTGNLSWTLTEIGAAAEDHNHDTVYLGINANAVSASKLKTPVSIGLTGVTATAQSFDGSANINIPITSIPSNLLTGVIDLSLIPAGALERMVVVEDNTARYQLTTTEVQVGDIVKVQSSGLMYYVKDQSNLASDDGYEVYTAGYATSVPWSGITNKPTFATVATSGSYNDLSNLPTIYQPSTSTPLIASGTGSVGTGTTFARADHVHPVQTSVSGNAGSATKLATARTFTIGNATAKSFDGTGNLSWTLSEIGAAATNHNHDSVYLGINATASAASKLATARTLTIGSTGKEFDGTKDVTWTLTEIGAAAAGHNHDNVYLGINATAAAATKLATGRTFTIGSAAAKSFDGTANLSWTLEEIGAAAASHTHAYLSTSGGTISGNLTVSGTLTISTAGSVSGISVVYTGTIGTSWSGSGPYTQTITVTGIKATDVPIVDFTCSGTYATDKAREEAFGQVYRIVANANSITVYAHEKTTTSCPIRLVVIR